MGKNCQFPLEFNAAAVPNVLGLISRFRRAEVSGPPSSRLDAWSRALWRGSLVLPLFSRAAVAIFQSPIQ